MTLQSNDVHTGREEMETIRFNAPSHLNWFPIHATCSHLSPLSPNLPAASHWLRRHVGALLRLTNVCYEDGCCCMSHYRPLGCLDRPILSQSQNICTGRPTRYLNKCSIIGTNCVGEGFSSTIWPEGMPRKPKNSAVVVELHLEFSICLAPK